VTVRKILKAMFRSNACLYEKDFMGKEKLNFLVLRLF